MKKVRDGYKMTELGEIPNEWEIIKLNECGYIFGGNAFKSSSFTTEYKENDYQVIRMGNVQLGKLDLEKNPVFLSENLVGEKEKKYLLKEADILISLTGTVNKTDYGNISWVDKNNKYLLNQRVGCLRNDNGEFNNRYYYYLLQSNMFRNQFFECGVGGTGNQANVSIADLNNIKVLKLPTREQEKIASILSTVDEQIDNVDALIEKNKELKKGLMQTLLTKGIGHTKFKKTEIGEIPEEWQNESLGDMVNFEGGTQPPKKYFSNECLDGMIRLIQIRDYKSDKFKVYVPKELCRRFCDKSDVMIGRYGPPIFQILRGLEGAYNVALIKATPINERLDREYLYYFLNNEKLFNLIDSLSQRTSGQTGIDMEVLKAYKIPIPPKKEQEKIVLTLSQIDKRIENYENRNKKLEELKKGLMQQLLTGKIRTI